MKIQAFFSDFTLGFSDGLTVPFALTAGLSYLGKTDTVIYAGLAELCAGCISMGIGGYQSARDATRQEAVGRNTKYTALNQESSTLLEMVESDEEGITRGDDGGEKAHSAEAVVIQYLRPLNLSAHTMRNILDELDGPFKGIYEASLRLSDLRNEDDQVHDDHPPAPPIISGLIVAFGYLCGGLIPLLPYCFSDTIAKGLSWSIGVCLLALFMYGAGKEWMMGVGARSSRILRTVIEGVRTMIFGATAAGAAVLCVTLVEKNL